MVIVVASDQHLGYSNSNSTKFVDFLQYLSNRNDVTDFVILGDFVDMWRRDISGLFLEQHEILQQVLDLKKKMKVHCVAGNHDYHLLKLTNHQYPLDFIKDLTIPSKGVTYVFKHGWEFDPAQWEPVMELLCDNVSDEAGKIRSEFWSLLTSMRTDFINFLLYLFKNHGGSYKKYRAHLLTPPKDRPNMTDVERRACSSVKPGEILIFGHTHRPFVNTANNVINSGSWVSDAAITNTYVELDGTSIHLMQYGVREITEREACPA